MKKLLIARNALRTIIASSALMVTLVGGAAFAQVDFSSTNGTTGPMSENLGILDVHNHSNIDITNRGDIKNDNNIEVETGDNWAHCNTQVDGLATGNVMANISVSNELGGADLSIARANGIGDINTDVTNELTGPNSENKNIIDIANRVDLDIRNDADINNDFNADVNTGHNKVGNNTVVGDVTTGDINLSSDTTNRVNTNAGSLNLSGLVGDNPVSADFSNEVTGPNSENINKVTEHNDVDIDVNNDVDINNDTNIDANTGHNSIDNNTCVGDVSTGSVTIDLNTTNIAN